jgi:hypothetical protein
LFERPWGSRVHALVNNKINCGNSFFAPYYVLSQGWSAVRELEISIKMRVSDDEIGSERVVRKRAK